MRDIAGFRKRPDVNGKSDVKQNVKQNTRVQLNAPDLDAMWYKYELSRGTRGCTRWRVHLSGLSHAALPRTGTRGYPDWYPSGSPSAQHACVMGTPAKQLTSSPDCRRSSMLRSGDVRG